MSVKTDQDVVTDGRKNPLKDVEVSLRERSLQKLVKKLEDLDEGQNTVHIWNLANNDRATHMKRQRALLQEFDEFIEPIYAKDQEWQSDIHLPTIFTACKVYHARFLSALLGMDPPFNVKARQAAYVDRAPTIQDVMKYSLFTWSNSYRGIEDVLDSWVWRWVTAGSGILKQRWDRKFERFMDIVERPVQVGSADSVDPQTGQPVSIPQTEMQEVEEEVTEKIFDGPCAEEVPEEDIVIVGGKGDPQEADSVIQQLQFTASDLWSMADQSIFRSDIVEEIIKSGENLLAGRPENEIKVQQAESAGESNLDKVYDLQRYTVLERYGKIDVDGSGINTEVILWVHLETGKILRATYLRRVMRAGLRPYSKIEFHRRNTREYPIGLPELLYSLAKELDALENIKLDVGVQTSLPIFFYRPTSSMNEERISFGPGQGIPTDNPQGDIYFPNLGNRTMFTSNEQGFLLSQVERLASISDITYGVIGGQGATRTATGTRALQQESSANLDVFLRRMNRGWKHFLIYHFHMLQEKLPPGLEMRMLGDDGQSYFRRIESRQELCGQYDFEIEGNSANSNPQVRLEQANTIYQMTGNMLDVQLGIITPLQRYEACKNTLQAQGVKDYGRYLNKPQMAPRRFTPLEISNRVLAGENVILDPTQDLQGLIDWFEEVVKNDDLLGMFNEQQTVMLAHKVQEAHTMMQAMEQQQRQFAAQQQVAINSSVSTGAPQQSNVAVQAPASNQ